MSITLYYIFDQINSALVSIRYVLSTDVVLNSSILFEYTYILLLYLLMDVHVAQSQAQLSRLSYKSTIGRSPLVL